MYIKIFFVLSKYILLSILLLNFKYIIVIILFKVHIYVFLLIHACNTQQHKYNASINLKFKSLSSSCVGFLAVILSNYYDLPFNDILDWHKFALILKELDVYRLKQILKDIPDDEFVALHKNLVEVVAFLSQLEKLFYYFSISYNQSASTLYMYCLSVCVLSASHWFTYTEQLTVSLPYIKSNFNVLFSSPPPPTPKKRKKKRKRK